MPTEPQNLTIIVLDSGLTHKATCQVRITVTEGNVKPPDINLQPTSGPGELVGGTSGLLTLVNLVTSEAVRFHLDSKSSAGGIFGIDVTNDHSVRLLKYTFDGKSTLMVA